MPLQQPCALVIGVGELEGIGGAVADRFAKAGMHVFLVGRTASKLDSVVQHIRQKGGHATALISTLEGQDEIDLIFQQLSAKSLEVLVYNAAYMNVPKRFLNTSLSFIEGNWRVSCLAGILSGQAAAKQMLSQGRGTIIYTGATASLRGKPLFAAFASAKAALRAFSRSLAIELAPQGIHVVHVVIDGVVEGQRSKRAMGGFGRILIGLIKRRNGVLSPEHIANNYWQIHQQNRGAWSHELELRPFKEPF